MKTHVTIVPSDQVIIVDNEALMFDFQSPENIHAIQWHNGKGHIEYADGRPNYPLAKDDYGTEVATFVAIWETEKARLGVIAKMPLTPEGLDAQKIADIDARLAWLDSASIRPLRALVDGSVTDEDKSRLAAIEREAAVLRMERKGLVEQS